jgi:hypothetical protein
MCPVLLPTPFSYRHFCPLARTQRHVGACTLRYRPVCVSATFHAARQSALRHDNQHYHRHDYAYRQQEHPPERVYWPTGTCVLTS